MAKLTLDDLASLQNETTAIDTINDNNAAIETALENTLSRDGTSPNSMGATLDMNSNRIINLPEPLSNTEPLRVIDAVDLAGLTVTPETATSILTKLLTVDGSASGLDTQYFAGYGIDRFRLKNTAITTYYARDDSTGNTGRDGKTNSAAGAFTAPGTCLDYITKNVDLGGYINTISIGPGVYAPFAPTVVTGFGSYCVFSGDPARTITNAVDNGAGLVRLTVNTASVNGHRALQTGDKVIIRGVLGTTEANTLPSAGPATITVIDSTHVDIQGSSFSNAYLSGGEMVCTLIQATGNSQYGISADAAILVAENIGFDSAGYSNFVCILARQFSILDTNHCTYHRASVHVQVFYNASFNETAVNYVTGNAAAHMQIFEQSRISIASGRYFAGGLAFTGVYYVYYNSFLTSSTSVTHTGPGAGGGSSPATGTQWVKFAGGRFGTNLTNSTWPGNVAGYDVGIGYGAGDGGAVTQATNKSTSVTLNKITGAITMNNASLADATTVTFQVLNNLVAATDNIVINHKTGGTGGAYIVQAFAPAGGGFNVAVRNVSGGSLSEAIVLSYTVIKGSIT